MRLHFASGVCLLVLTLSASVYSYKIGAPLEVCRNMTPTAPHPGNISTVASPYVIRPTLNTIWSNESLPVIIESNTTPNVTTFKGYMMMARWTDSDDVEPIGTFSTATDGHTMDCGRTTQNTVTQNDEIRFESIEAVWHPPENFDGSVTFWATVVQGGKTYWVNLTSDPVVIKPIESNGATLRFSAPSLLFLAVIIPILFFF